MERPLSFSRVGSRVELNGELHQHLAFVDICAAFGERLRAWRTKATESGLPAARVRASMAVDIEPRDEDVHELDVCEFLQTLPAKSVHIMNGDWINVVTPKFNRKHDAAGGLPGILKDIRRVLDQKGELYLTMPLHTHREVLRTMADFRMKVETIAFGYAGFLGGQNDEGFPSAGLPPVPGESHFIRTHLESVKQREESDSPVESLFANWIGTHGYLGDNPVRYRATKLMK